MTHHLGMLQCPSRRFREKESDDVTLDIGPLPTTVDIDVDLEVAENERSDCEGIYIRVMIFCLSLK